MFPNTQWTDLARATLHGDSAGRAALESLCRTYWEPMRQAVLMKGWNQDDAEDLVQSFFLELMASGALKKADRERGKFRTFLQGVLGHWLTDEYRKRQALKRGGGEAPLSLDDLGEGSVPTDGEDAATSFDRAWARAVMTAGLARVQAELSAKHGDECFATMGPFLGAGGEAGSYEEAGRRIGLTLSAFKSEVHAWRRRLRECLRAEVRRTVSAPHEIDEEMDYLRELLAAG
jgi:DNA-directed RNA polymerase specialized sigma24 family protein